MPSVSKKQQRFMQMVHARQSGHPIGNATVEKAARSMDPTDVMDFMHLKGERRQKKTIKRKRGHPTDQERYQGYLRK